PVGSVDRDADTLSTIADARPQMAAALRQELAGNLDNIVLKCLRKEPEQRYESVTALREDLLRHLNGWTVLAPAYVPRSKSDSVKSIAILPLKLLNLSGSSDTSENFLGVGLADAMITRLSGARLFEV